MSHIPWTKCERIGAGTFAAVYRCKNNSLNTEVALKQIFNIHGKSKRETFYNEVGILRNLENINIVKYYGTLEDDDSVGILMEYVRGGSVRMLIEEKGPLCEETVRKFSLQILEGLEYLHGRQIIHRDLKCTNVLLDEEHNCKLADFGLSKEDEDIHSVSGAKTDCGSFYWRSPESLSGGKYGWKSDIWSFGCTMFEMLTKEPPYHKDTVVIAANKVISVGVTPPLTTSIHCREFMEMCFKQNAKDRPSAKKLLQHNFILVLNES